MLVIERVWKEKRELLYTVACSVSGDEGLAEDLMQEAFARVLQSNRRLEDCESAFRFICKTITNLAIDAHRRRRRHQRIRGALHRAAAGRAPSPVAIGPLRFLLDQETGLFRDSLMREVHLAVQSLTDNQREALDLMFGENRPKPLQDFCREKGVPYSTLRSRWLKAVDLIRRRLRRKGFLNRLDEVKSA